MWFKSTRSLPRPKRLADIKGSEAKFLAGRYSRISEAVRLLKILWEFVRSFQKFHFLPAGVTVFGSARFKEGHKYYKMARDVGALLAKEGFVVITGGGPGIMEAANRGAFETGGVSVGASIQLPAEEHANPYLNKRMRFHYFFVRKVILVKYSVAFIVFPGGFGTMDELYEALTLIQTGKLYDFPVILVGKDYWNGLLEWTEKTLIPNGTISPEDTKYLFVTDDPAEVVRITREVVQKLGLQLKSLSA